MFAMTVSECRPSLLCTERALVVNEVLDVRNTKRYCIVLEIIRLAVTYGCEA
jgi:hypothetical protein